MSKPRAPYRKLKIKVGDVFKNLTVIAESTRTSGGHEMYMCRCVCGVEKLIRKNNLDVVIGCGCVRKKYRPKQRVQPTRVINDGDVFHDWTVLNQSDKTDDKGEIYFLCKCVCGVKRSVRKSSLGKAQGCGCSRKKNGEISLTRRKTNIPTKRPEKETNEQIQERKKKVTDTLEGLVDSAGGDLEPIYNVPPARLTSRGNARAQIESLLAERKLQRELDELEYNFDF